MLGIFSSIAQLDAAPRHPVADRKDMDWAGNAFHHSTREEFDAAIMDLDQRVDRMDGDSIHVALQKIASLIGARHTYVTLPVDTSRFPIEIRRFQNEYRVIPASADYKDAVGTRVLRLDDLGIERAHALLPPLTPQDETPIVADNNRQRSMEGDVSSGA